MKYWVILAVTLTCLCGALLLRDGFSVAPGRERPGVVVIDSRSVAPVRFAQRPAALPLPRGQAVAGSPADRQDDPRQLYAMVRSEPRDTVWANSSEALIKDSLGAVPYLGRGSPFEVTCATTVCEVTGVAAAGAQPETIQRAWDSLRPTINTSLIVGHGLQSTAATFGSGHSLHAFTIYYRRTNG